MATPLLYPHSTLFLLVLAAFMIEYAAASPAVINFHIDSATDSFIDRGANVEPVSYSYKHTQSCPCDKPEWCQQVSTVYEKEVFAFSIRNDENNWNKFDWTKLTTVVMFGYLNESLMCLAHSHNVRVVLLGHIDESTFIDPQKRKTWILDQLVTVKSNFVDGINFDFESAVGVKDKKLRDAYTQLVKETNEVFKRELPHSQVSVDVAWKPNVDGRFYDYSNLALSADLLFVMAYDEQSQIFGECVAGPNSDLYRTAEGLNAYLEGFDKKITADKLVLGVPWYGYIYNCTHLDGDKCHLRRVPFRGANCSDAAGKQYDYSFISKMVQSMPENYKWNSSSFTPFLTDSSSFKSYQIQFDDPTSLKVKYNLASSMFLKGVGMWNIDSLDYTDTDVGKGIREAMFGALPSRTKVASMSSNKKVTTTSQACPCSDPKLCEPIKNTTRKEVYAFSLKNDENYWNKYDWSKITTICMYKYINTSLMCLAHSHGVRAVTLGEVKTITMITPGLRKDWVAKQLQIVKENFLDGLNFDYENGISPKQKDLRDAYTAIVTETREAFKKELPYSQISVDVIVDAFSTYRAYDYQALAAASDFLFLMAYDESGFSRTGPNSGVPQTLNGINSFLKDNITADKLVLGLPWYAYVYRCIKLEGDVCTVDTQHKGSQVGFGSIFELLETMPTHYRWDAKSSTPFYSYTASNVSYQVWFDDPWSLKIKYLMAEQMGLRGVGMWTIDFLDYGDCEDCKEMRDAMFQPLPSY